MDISTLTMHFWLDATCILSLCTCNMRNDNTVESNLIYIKHYNDGGFYFGPASVALGAHETEKRCGAAGGP